MRWSLVLGLVFLFIFIPQASAFDLQQVYIRIDTQGDATITITYQDTFVEYSALKHLLRHHRL